MRHEECSMLLALAVLVFAACSCSSTPARGTPQTAVLGQFESQTDVGHVEHPGSAKFDSSTGQYRVTGSGANIWGKEDAFHYVWRKVSGGLIFSADVQFVGTGGDKHRKACLMVRRDLAADAPYADVAVHGDGLISLQYRTAAGGPTMETQSSIRAPATVRLIRRGNVFTLLVAPHGEPLQSVGSMEVPLADPVYAGLAVSSHDAAVSETAVFSHVSLRAGNRSND